MSAHQQVFISYARSDGSTFVSELRTRLAEQSIAAWQDTYDLWGGTNWRQEIKQAIHTSSLTHLLLVLTESAIDRPIIQWECRLARRAGKVVIPILADPQLDVARLPQWITARTLLKLHNTDDWDKFFLTLKSPYRSPRFVNMASRLERGFVPRPGPMAELKRLLIDSEHGCPISNIVALVGTGGFGKTTLAWAFCQDDDVLDIYYDGILWVDLKKEPGDLTGLVLNLIERLEGRRPAYTDLRSAVSHLQELLEQLAFLIVIDDAWEYDDVDPFIVGGSYCGWLITTRNHYCPPDDAKVLDIGEMSTSEAKELLGAGIKDSLGKSLVHLAQRLGHWPLLLAIANGQLRAWVASGRSPNEAIKELDAAFQERGPTAFDLRRRPQRRKAIASILDIGLGDFDEGEVNCFVALGVFPPGTNIPLPVVSSLWASVGKLTQSQTRELCERLGDVCLIQRLDLATMTIRIADAIRTVLKYRCKKHLQSLHDILVQAYTTEESSSLPCAEAYVRRFLPWHLLRAGRARELKALLLNYRWIQAKLGANGIGALLEDFALLSDDPDIALVCSAIRLSVRYIAHDPQQLAPQLKGRLAGMGRAAIDTLMRSIETYSLKPLLLHRLRGFREPGGVLVCPFPALPERITSLGVRPDGRLAITGGLDARLRLWDLATGVAITVLPNCDDSRDQSQRGHERAVNAVAFLCAERESWVLSGSEVRRDNQDESPATI